MEAIEAVLKNHAICRIMPGDPIAWDAGQYIPEHFSD
jgi:hypothetical protein